MSSASASTHSPACSQSSANEAPTRIPVPSAVLMARPLTDVRSPGSSRLAMMKSAIWASRTTA